MSDTMKAIIVIVLFILTTGFLFGSLNEQEAMYPGQNIEVNHG